MARRKAFSASAQFLLQHERVRPRRLRFGEILVELNRLLGRCLDPVRRGQLCPVPC